MISASRFINYFQDRKRTLYILIGLLVAKIFGDLILAYSFGSINYDANLLWKFVTTVLIVFFGYLYLKEIIKPKVQTYDSSFTYSYLKDLLTLILLLSISLVLGIFIDSFRNWANHSKNYFSTIIQVFGWFYLLYAYYSITLLTNWINNRKNHRTKIFYKIFIGTFITISAVVFIIQPLDYLDLTFFTDLGNGILIIAFIATTLYSFLLPFDNDFIKLLNNSDRRKLFWYSFAIVLIGFSTIIVTTNSDTGIYYSLNIIYPKLDLYFLFSVLILTSYQARILLTFRKSKRNAEYRQKFDSIATLTEFNRYILNSNTTNRAELLEVFMQSLIKVIECDFAWAEDYDDENICCYRTIHNTNSGFLENFNHLPNFRERVLNMTSVTTIGTLLEFAPRLRDIFFEGTLSIIPIYERTKRVGTIFIGRRKAYSFSYDEIQILNTFAINYAVAIENSLLMQESLERKRYMFELQLAQSIQKKIIPQQIPKISNYSIAGVSIPASELGGDYYDIVYLKNGQPTLLIADVSGKGVSAALYMSQLKGVIMSICSYSNSPKELLINLNSILHKNTEKQIFITLAAITIENNSGLIKYVRAGHSPILFKHNDSVYEKASKGIALGVSNSQLFDKNLEEIEMQLEANDLIFAYTDGFDELRNNKNEEFGLENIKKIILEQNPKEAQDLINETIKKIKSYMNGTSQYDDLTLLTLIYKGKE
jgi:serine phosphatase RsbU (regulator of sigma subunit)